MNRTIQAARPHSRRAARLRSIAALTAVLLGAGSASIVTPAWADPPQGGTPVVAEPFSGAVVADSAWTSLQDACLTGAPSGAAPQPGAAAIPSCAAHQNGAVPAMGVEPGYLQLTDNGYLREGSILYNRPIPASSGVSITFEQYQYGGSGADGIGFFLVDGSTDLEQPGGRGGSLGYAPFVDEPGVRGGYLGVGLDAYGNYYNDAEGRGAGCPAGQRSPSTWSGPAAPNVITLRGPGDGTAGYCWLASTIPSPSRNIYSPGTTLDGGNGTLRAADIASAKRLINIEVQPADKADPRVIVRVQYTDGGPWVDELDIPLPAGGPATYKFGLSASTGYSTDVHLVRQVAVDTVRPLSDLQLEKQVDRSGTPLPAVITAGTGIPYVYTVTNAGSTAVTALEIIDDRIDSADITCSRTTLDPAPAPTSTTTCTGVYTVTDADVAAPEGAVTNTASAQGTVGALSVESSPRTVTVPLVSSITLEKTVNTEAPYSVGQQIEYGYVARNTGGSDLVRVEVVDDKIPSGVVCPSSSLAPGTEVACTAVMTIAASDLTPDGSLVNVATASAATPVGQVVESPPVSRSVAVATDIAVDVSVDDTEPVVGSTATFTVTVTNNGPVAATGVRISESSPSSSGDRRFVVTAAAPSSGAYDGATGAWTIPRLEVGASTTLLLSGTVGTGTTITESASVTSVDQYDRVPSNDRDQAVINAVVPTADIAVAIDADIASLTLGEVAIFTARVTNNGPFDATGVAVGIPLPPSLPLTAGRPPGGDGTLDPGSGVWTVGALAVNETKTLDFAVDASQVGSYRLIASLRPDSSPQDVNAANDTDTASLDVLNNPADLSVLKRASSTDATAGDEITYDVVASNAGPATAQSVEVLDTAPPGMTLVSVARVSASGEETPLPLPAAGAPVRWEVGTLTAGESAQIRVRAVLTATGTIVNAATISSPLVDDPTPGNNAATATVRVGDARANIAIAKIATDAGGAAVSSVPVGGDVWFTLSATHTSGVDATGVSVLDRLPAGLSFIEATGDGDYDAEQGVWTIGDVPIGETAALRIHTRADAAGSLVNASSLRTMNESDSDPADNVATASVRGTPDTDLVLTKTAGSSTVRLGGTTTYTVTIRNDGPTVARDVIVADPGLGADIAGDVTAGTYDPASGRWAIPTLSVGESHTLTVTVPADVPGRHENTAGVISTTSPDTDPSNNVATARFSVPAADIVVTKAVDRAEAYVGDTIVFTIGVANAGPDASGALSVADLLPAGLAFESAQASQGSYDAATGTWSLPDGLAPADLPLIGTQAQLTLSARPTTTGTFQNTADADRSSAEIADPDPDNNAASATVTVTAAPAELHVTKTADRAAVVVGDVVTFTLGVANTGPGAAADVELVDSLPDGLADAEATDERCTVVGSAISCSLGDLPAGGEARSVTVTARPSATGPVVNTAVASSSSPLADASTLEAAVTVTAVAASDPGASNPGGGSGEGGDVPGGTLPTTGGQPPMMAAVVGGLLLLLGIVAILSRRRRSL